MSKSQWCVCHIFHYAFGTQSGCHANLSAGAQETLCGQAFGAKHYRAVGIVLQRALLITLLLGALICALWSQTERLMLAMGQDPVIAAGTRLSIEEKGAFRST